jgi:hypothetical protein
MQIIIFLKHYADIKNCWVVKNCLRNWSAINLFIQQDFMSFNLRAFILLLVLSMLQQNISAQKRSSRPSAVSSATSSSESYSAQTGAMDREECVGYLYKISYPVVHNLAQSTLKKKMPVETSPDYDMQVKKVTYTEAVGRTIAGLAPWLSLPDDNSIEGEMRKKIRNELLLGLRNAVDPASPDYLNFRTERQNIVDAAYFAHAFLRAPAALWEPLDSLTKQRFIEEFKSLRSRAAVYNNWLLFAALTEGFLLKAGADFDPARIDFAVRKMKDWYAGDSWYKDGDLFSMDYYNSYVIHPMLVDLLAVLLEKKWISHDEYNLAVKRMVRNSEFLERIIAPDGTYPAMGRSITYRSGAFQVLSQVALMQKLPDHVSPSQVRCALTSVSRKLFKGNQNFDSNGWLVLGFNGHQPMVADQYTSTGSLYMATLGFLHLGLPANNPLWTDPSKDWTSKKAWNGLPVKRDYKVEY